MWDYLFKDISKILYEPIAVCVIIYLVWTLFFFRKKDKLFYWGFLLTVIFMVGWRLACHKVMLSSRYSALLIYPALIITACLCGKVHPFFRWLLKKLHLNFSGKTQICRFLTVVVFVGLLIACLAKALHLNPYGNYWRKISQTYLKHSNGTGEVHTISGERNRLTYYAAKQLKEINVLTWKADELPIDFVKKNVTLVKNIPGNHYFFYYLRKGNVEPTAENMQQELSGGKWQILDRQYLSKRKNKELVLALYQPTCPNIEEWNQPIPPMPAKNLCRNGDFETVVPPASVKNLEKQYQKLGVVGYTDLSNRKLPTTWWFNLNKYNKDNPADIRLLDQSPLAGKYSLYIDSRAPRKKVGADACSFIYNKNCRYSFFVKALGNEKSQLILHTLSRNQKLKKYKFAESMNFYLEPGKTYRIHGKFFGKEAPEGWQSFWLAIHVRGCVLLDQLSIVEIP